MSDMAGPRVRPCPFEDSVTLQGSRSGEPVDEKEPSSEHVALITVRSILTAGVGLLILLPRGDGGHEPARPCGRA